MAETTRRRMRHTPGPWQVRGPAGDIDTEGDPYGHGHMCVAYVRGWGHLTGQGGGCACSEKMSVESRQRNRANA